MICEMPHGDRGDGGHQVGIWKERRHKFSENKNIFYIGVQVRN
jgi:hypothetical protein